METGLDLRLLGPLEALARGEPVVLSGRKPRALVAVLALDAGRVVSVDRLVDELWPGMAPATAGHAVKVYVSQLRKTLGTGAIATRGPGYALELHPDRVDAHRFRSLLEEGRAVLGAGEPARAGQLLREALALWRGPALVDFAYEPFAQTAIAELEELRLAALEERIEADLALGLHGELVGELKVVVASNATRERVWGQLMLALYRAGRQADALASYRAARKALVEGLGIEPGPELRELEAAILRQDPSLLPQDAPAAPLRTRRLVTILSVDVEVAGELDAEREHDALERAGITVVTVAARYGASAQRPGDGSVVAAFGVPVAHEDDPLRAARSALDVREAVASLAAELGVELDFRTGIETGEIVAVGAKVEGGPVKAAARLRQSAGPSEIRVGDEAARVLADSARFDGDRLVELAAAAAPFARQLDGPLVGRASELRVLKGALRKAKTGGTRAVLVTGTAGIGKSRLALELGRTRDVTTIVGKCPAYGDGLTYAPLRALVAEAAGGTEREALLPTLGAEPDADAIVTALAGTLGEADTPVPAAEVAWAFRRLCETLAQPRPLVVVVDDLHWAEQTFLELVEHLVDRAGDAPILVVGLAREELLEERPAFLAERTNAETLDLPALSREETAALLAGLGGGALPAEQRARILDTAEGNPLYVEQLLALAAEGGLAGERPLPHTIESLLATRLDRLGPAERMVLGRGAVVGRSFSAEALTALLVPEAVPSVERHLGELVARGFLREDGDAGFRFRHVLLQEAAYRATPKAERAELHERHADLLAQADERDELVGYHLEQAHRLRTEIGLADRRTERLAEDAGRRLGAAGRRAAQRGDVHATLNLVGRATALLPNQEMERRELLCELAIAQRAIGDAELAEETLDHAVCLAQEAGDRRIELRATIERSYLRLLRSAEDAAAQLLRLSEAAIPVLEAVRDNRALGRVWLLSGFVHGGVYCREASRVDAARRALGHYQRSGWPTGTCLGELAIALHDGPENTTAAIAQLERLLATAVTDRAGEANVLVFVGGLEAMRGNVERGRRLAESALRTYEDLGHLTAITAYYAPVRAYIESLEGRTDAAAEVLRRACRSLELAKDLSHLSSRAAELATVLALEGHLGEAETWIAVARKCGSPDDLATEIEWRRAQAILSARRGDHDAAIAHACEATDFAAATDQLNRQGAAFEALGDALERSGRSGEAKAARETARERYETKGNVLAGLRVESSAANAA